MSEPLCCSPEAITILLIGYTPIQSMEKGIATRSSILAWRIPWTEEPGGLQSMGSQRIEHDWATNTQRDVRGFPGGSVVKEPACQCGRCRRHRDTGSVPGSGRAPGEGNSNPLQYSCLETPMDRGAWRAIVHEITESDVTEHALVHSFNTK